MVALMSIGTTNSPNSIPDVASPPLIVKPCIAELVSNPPPFPYGMGSFHK
jgi:hypothetical protein